MDILNAQPAAFDPPQPIRQRAFFDSHQPRLRAQVRLLDEVGLLSVMAVVVGVRAHAVTVWLLAGEGGVREAQKP